MEEGIQPEGATAGVTGIAVSPSSENIVIQPESAALDTLEQRVGVLQNQQVQAQEQTQVPGVVEPGIQEVASASIVEGGASSEGMKDFSVSEEAGNPAKEPSAQEIGKKAPVSEAPKVPGKVAGDIEFRQKWGESYAQAKQQGGEVNVVQIDRQALSEYYSDWAKTQVEQGLPDEIKNDPLYQQRLGEAMTAAQDRGETLDAKNLSQEALAKYKQEKDLQEEQETRPPQAEQQLTESEQRLQQLEQKVDRLSLENTELSSELAQMISSMAVILPSVKELLETAQKQEQDPKKKETLIQLLSKLAAVMALSIFVEAGRDVVKK